MQIKIERFNMVEIWYVDGDRELFETAGIKPWKWIPEQQSYLIQSIEGDIVIPSAFVKRLRYIEV